MPPSKVTLVTNFLLFCVYIRFLFPEKRSFFFFGLSLMPW